jgi:hypothetical protein
MEWWLGCGAHCSNTPPLQQKSPGIAAPGLVGKIERVAQCLQVLQSVVFLLSQQALVPEEQQAAFFGAKMQVLQLERLKTAAMRARVASDFMSLVVLLDEMKRPVMAGCACGYEHAKQALFLASTKSQEWAGFTFSASSRARFASSMRWPISQMPQLAT